MNLGPGDRLDRYTIEAEIGHGGMGRVYRAYDARLCRRVALKVLRPDRLEDASLAVPRVLREARAAAALHDPGSAAIFDVGEVSGIPFIAMEHVVGRSLRSHVGDEGLPIATRLGWLREIARVLGAAHAAGLVHRDVKPENVMVRADGAVKVLDFGIARRMDDDAAPLAPWPGDPDAATFDESSLAGTPAYMAPEQAQRRAVDARADQFAWGVVAYELLTGALPWRSAREGVTTLVAVVTEQQESLSPLPGVPRHVAAVVDRALEKDPARRFATMSELLAALDPAIRARPPRRPGHATWASLAEGGTTFVGREAELTRLGAWISEKKRLITILGPPGAGKTRLARAAAEGELAARFDGRVWFVDLSEAEGLADVVHAAARALGLSLSLEVGGAASLSPLGATLAVLGRAAMILDGVDRIAARHAGAVRDLLDVAPGLSVIVTSRARLALAGEHVLELGPLSLPAEADPDDAIARSEAVSLFVDRARAARRGREIDAAELPRVAAIVRLLDGLPLGIELAAARMSVLDAEGLLERLRRGSGVLGRDRRGGPASTIEASIEASWALLDPAERSALAQCSVFRGGFDVDAAEAVIELADLPAGEPAPEVIDVLDRLLGRSLLATRGTESTGKSRFFLYLAIRDFAATRLDPAALRGASRRHARWYATRARLWADAVRETGSAASLAPLSMERDNLRAIAERLGPDGDAELLFDAILAIDPLEHVEGSIEAHLGVIDRALAGAGASAALRARMLAARGRALVALGRAREALAALESARAASPEIEAEALVLEAQAHAALGARDRAWDRATEAKASAARAGQALFAARADAALAALAWDDGRIAEAEGRWERARIALRIAGARADEGQAALALGLARAALGSTEDALRLVADATAILATAADPRLHAAARSAFGSVALDLGRGAETRAACEEARGLARQLADRSVEAAALSRLARVHLDEGDGARAEAEALAAIERARDPREQARALGILAIVAWDRAQGDAAGEHARRAIDLARAAGDRLAEGLLSALLGAVEASAGRSTEAEQAFDAAREAHEAPRGGTDVEAARLAEAFEDLRRAARSNEKSASEHRARARARLARVLAPGPTHDGAASGSKPRAPSEPSGAPLARRSFVVRTVARRVLRALGPRERALAWAEALDADGRALVVDMASRAVRLPGAPERAWVSLAADRRLFRLLTALVDQRLRGARDPVSAGELVEVLWPGEGISADGAERLVEHEIAALRAMGLGEVVRDRSGRYDINPATPVLEVPGTL